MRKIALGMAVAATALASPALARDGQAYFGADIGYADPNNHDVINNGVDDGTRVNEDNGYDLGAFLGYDWGPIRTEAEVAYYDFNPNSVNGGTQGIPLLDTVAPYDVGGWALTGESHVTTLMANALLDLGGNEGVGLSLGGGVGRAFLDSQFLGSPTNTYLDSSDSAWAYQAIAALRIPVTKAAEFGVKYKYLNTSNFNMLDTAGRGYNTDLAIHSAIFHA